MTLLAVVGCWTMRLKLSYLSMACCKIRNKAQHSISIMILFDKKQKIWISYLRTCSGLVFLPTSVDAASTYWVGGLRCMALARWIWRCCWSTAYWIRTVTYTWIAGGLAYTRATYGYYRIAIDGDQRVSCLN